VFNAYAYSVFPFFPFVVVCSSVFWGEMFAVQVSYCYLLAAVCRRLSCIGVSCLTEVLEDGSVAHGLEVEISSQQNLGNSTVRIFWDCPAVGCLTMFECAALQSVTFLQVVYGFVVIDYNFYAMLAYRTLSKAAAQTSAATVNCCHCAPQCSELSKEVKSSLSTGAQLSDHQVGCLAAFL
jgi:hypothetical protein